MNSYEKQAQDFLTKTNTELSVKYVRTGRYWDTDKDVRDIYEFTLQRGNRKYVAPFGQSMVNSTHYEDRITKRTTTDKSQAEKMWGVHLIVHKAKAPTAYDILACLTKYNPGTFEDFCRDFGYDTDSKTAEKTYNAVVQEWLHVSTLWTDAEIEELQEIQ